MAGVVIYRGPLHPYRGAFERGSSLACVSSPEPSRSQLTTALEAAVARLRRNDGELCDTTERVVVARLMIYLEEELRLLPNPQGFRLDMEYERAETNPKAFYGLGPNGHPFRRKIVPDLVYHRRGVLGGSANHLAIEVKAQRGRREDHDVAKLALLTGRAAYAYALFTPRVLRLPGRCDPPDPPPDRHVVVLPHGFQPYTFGALLRLYQDEEFIEWI